MSKAEGHAEGIYLPISEEFEAGLFGSIFCRDLSLYKNGEMIRGFMISIATYNTAFGSPKDPYDVNLCKEVFEDIVNFLKPELATICLTENINIEGYIDCMRKENDERDFKNKGTKKKLFRAFRKAKHKNIKA